MNPGFPNFAVFGTFFKVEENVLLVQFQFILPNAHPNRFVFESMNQIIKFFLYKHGKSANLLKLEKR